MKPPKYVGTPVDLTDSPVLAGRLDNPIGEDGKNLFPNNWDDVTSDGRYFSDYAEAKANVTQASG